MTPAALEDVWRRESAHVLGALLRRHGDLGDCEDSAQEALEAAMRQWPVEGVPESPRGWLIRVASRRLVDRFRADRSRSDRELAVHLAVEPLLVATGSDAGTASDDDLELLLLCCHPALSRTSQVALTLRAVSGFDVRQVAAALLVPEATLAQRLTRARSTLRAAGARLPAPSPAELPARIAAVLDVLHLVFTEGSSRSSGDAVTDAVIAHEAIRLTRRLHRQLPDHDEVSGALALMLLTHARMAATTDAAGDLIPLRDQDRDRWDRALIDEGTRLLERALPHGHVGRFQVQASIAAVHAGASTWQATDWPQIVLLYAMLETIAPSPLVTLNRAVAVGMVHGPAATLALVDRVLADRTVRHHHRPYAVQAHLLDEAGDHRAASTAFLRAAALTASRPEQRYLIARAARSDLLQRPHAPETPDPHENGITDALPAHAERRR